MRTPALLSLLGALSVFLSSPARADLPLFDLNSVSVLFPKPVSNQPGFHSRMKEDTLFSPKLANSIRISEHQIVDKLSEIDWDSNVKDAVLIGLRIDPCFRDSIGGPCQKQLRAVWQTPRFDGHPSAFYDGAIHTFYELDTAGWNSALADWKKIWAPHAQSLRGVALQTNPVLTAEGMSGPTAEALSSFVRKHMPSKAMTRVALSVLYFRLPTGTLENGWKFFIYNVKDEVASFKTIPGMSSNLSMLVFENLADDFAFDSGNTVSRLTDRPENDAIHRFFWNSRHVDHLQNDEAKALFRSMVRLQNPNFHTPETTDCLSCHVARSAESIHGAKLSNDVKTAASQGQRYTNPRYNLSVLSPNIGVSRNFRMFGYFRGSMSINPRVIHESAEVADFLNAL